MIAALLTVAAVLAGLAAATLVATAAYGAWAHRRDAAEAEVDRRAYCAYLAGQARA